VTAIVSLSSAASAIAGLAACAYSAEAASLADAAAAACDAAGADTNSSAALGPAFMARTADVRTAQSIQSGAQAAALLLLCVMFVAVVLWSLCVMRLVRKSVRLRLLGVQFRSTPSAANSTSRIIKDVIQASDDHQLRMTLACALVLLAFPLRAAFEVREFRAFISQGHNSRALCNRLSPLFAHRQPNALQPPFPSVCPQATYAYASFAAPQSAACDVCAPCQTVQFLLRQWLNNTPHIRPILVAFSSPLPLLLSVAAPAQRLTSGFVSVLFLTRAMQVWLLSKSNERANAIAHDVEVVMSHRIPVLKL
jgi:hypothetical protein